MAQDSMSPSVNVETAGPRTYHCGRDQPPPVRALRPWQLVGFAKIRRSVADVALVRQKEMAPLLAARLTLLHLLLPLLTAMLLLPPQVLDNSILLMMMSTPTMGDRNPMMSASIGW